MLSLQQNGISQLNWEPKQIPNKNVHKKQTYVFVVVERVEDVVRQTGEQVDDEPALEVVHSDDFGVGNDFTVRSNEGRVKIEYDVDKEDDVDDRIDHQQTNVFRRLILKGNVVGHHDGRVEGEAQDDPVPQGLKGAVMQQDVRRRFRCLLAVLRKNVRIQAHHLFYVIREKRTHTHTHKNIYYIQ